MHYNGFTLETRDEVDSHVMIDFVEVFSSRDDDDWQPNVESLIGREPGQKSDDEACSADCCRGEKIHEDAYAEKKRNEDYITSLIPEDPNRDPSVAIYPRALQDTKSTENALTVDDMVIMSYRVFGFVLRSRKWGKSTSHCPHVKCHSSICAAVAT
jgi:hypothetical protein